MKARAGAARQRGFGYFELVLALLAAAFILAGMNGLFGTLLNSSARERDSHARLEAAQFALDQMARNLAHARILLLPLADRPATATLENQRVSHVPAVAGDKGALLAVSLDASLDRDGDGRADADNDGDGRVDEDWPADLSADGAPGVQGVDDDADGSVDEPGGDAGDDDESGSTLAPQSNEDAVDGVDNDGDGSVDEDPGADMNGDGRAGVAGVDDDGDGAVDEGNAADDDEDGLLDEDGVEAVVYFLRNGALVMRSPVPWDADGNGVVDNRDSEESVLLEQVASLRVERVALAEQRTPLVDLQLTLAATERAPAFTLQRTVRVDSAP